MCIFVKISYMLCRVNHYEMYEVRVNLIKSGKSDFLNSAVLLPVIVVKKTPKGYFYFFNKTYPRYSITRFEYW